MSHRISVLYFAGCPNHPPVVERIQRVVAEHALDAVVEEVELNDPADAERLRFLGSPTVQVDGVDIEPAARTRTDYAMSCRVYNTPDGLPPEPMLLDALGIGSVTTDEGATGAKADQLTHAGAAATAGSVVTAMLSSACCWLPLTLLAFGASAGGLSAFFERWRPYFAGVSIVMLSLGFYLAYFRAHTCSDDGHCSVRARRRLRLTRATLWVSAVVVVAFVSFPKYAGALVEAIKGGASAAQPASVNPASSTMVYDVQGMTCPACAATLRADLATIPGVESADVDFTSGTARVRVVDPAVGAALEDTVRRHGFTATPAVPTSPDTERRAP